MTIEKQAALWVARIDIIICWVIEIAKIACAVGIGVLLIIAISFIIRKNAR